MTGSRTVAVARAPASPTLHESVRLGKRGDHTEARVSVVARTLLVSPAPPLEPLRASLARPMSRGSDLPLGAGQPLNLNDRNYFEPRLGQALGTVRIHQGQLADLAARGVGAEAFALDNHIVCRSRNVDRGLLAHELAHVVDGERGVIRRKDLSGEATVRHLTPQEIHELKDDDLAPLYKFMNTVAYDGGLNDPGFAANYNTVRAEVEDRQNKKADAQKPAAAKPAPVPGVTDQSGPALLVNVIDAIARMKQIASGDDATGGWFEIQWQGAPRRISGVDAAKLHKGATDSVREGLAATLRVASSARTLYEVQSETNRKHWIVAPIIQSIGEIKDPGPVMLGLASSAEATVAKAKKSLAAGDFATAARLLVNAESNARQAEVMVRTYWQDIIFAGETTVKALEIVRDVSFAVLAVTTIIVSGGAALGVGGISVGTASSVGTVATFTPVVAAFSEGIAKEAMGDKVDWGALTIDAAFTALIYTFLGPLSKWVGEGMTKMLVAQAGRTLGKELIARAVVGVILGRGAAIFQAGVKDIYENSFIDKSRKQLSDKRPITWRDFVNQIKAMMLDPRRGFYDLVAISLGILPATKLRLAPAGTPAPTSAPVKPAENAPKETLTPAAKPKPAVEAEAPRPAPAMSSAPKPEAPTPQPKIEEPLPTATKPGPKPDTEPRPTAPNAAATKSATEPESSKTASPNEKSAKAKPEGSVAEPTLTKEQKDADLAARVTKLREIALSERQRLEKLSTQDLMAEAKSNLKKLEGAKGGSLAGKTIDDLSSAGKVLDPADKSGQFSLAGRALQKHGSREGSAFPSVKGSPSEINAQGQKIADDILSNPASTVTYKDTGRFGKVMDVIAPDGRGLRYDASGKFIGLLEPPKP